MDLTFLVSLSSVCRDVIPKSNNSWNHSTINELLRLTILVSSSIFNRQMRLRNWLIQSYFILYLVGAWYPVDAARPAKKGKCFKSNLSSIQSSIKSLIIGVQRDIWYWCSLGLSFLETWYIFLRFPYKAHKSTLFNNRLEMI